MAWASTSPAPAAPVVPASSPRRTGRARWAVACRGHRARPRRRRGGRGRSSPGAAPSTVLGYVAGGHDRLRRGPPRPAGRPAPGRRRVPLEVPGLRRPGRARDQARRDPRPAGQERHERRADVHRATSSRGSTASSRSASGRCPPARRSPRATSPRWVVPRPRAPVGQGRGRRPGLVRRRDREDRRHDHDRDLQRHDPHRLRAGAAASAAALRDHRRQGRRRRRPRVGQGRDRHQRRTAASRRARSQGRPRRRDGDHVGFVYVALRLAPGLVDRPDRVAAGRRRRAIAPLGDAMLKTAVPEWAAYWLRVERRRARHRGRRRPSRRRRSGRPRTATSPIVEHVPASAVVAAISNDFGTTLSRDSTSTRPSRASSRCWTSSTRRSASSAALSCPRLGRRHAPSSSTLPDGDARGRPRRRADRQGRRRAAVHRASRVPRARWRPAGHHRPRRDYDGTTITIVDVGDLGELAGGPSVAAAPARRRRSRSPTR